MLSESELKLSKIVAGIFQGASDDLLREIRAQLAGEDLVRAQRQAGAKPACDLSAAESGENLCRLQAPPGAALPSALGEITRELNEGGKKS